MASVEIYTTPFCGFCHAAKRLLTEKEVSFAETDVSRAPDLREAMIQRSFGKRTVPQIFIGGNHVGGFNELYALEQSGKLDALLAA